jgi:aryl-alcohol dehydrogenase-like predicted oxidoreductase
MYYRVLGSTGLKVSVIGVGTWQFGGEWGRNYSQADVDAILDAAEACGINLIDTAECYGDHLSESLIGDYLSRRDRSRWIIATKFGHHFKGFLDRDDLFSATDVLSQLEASLRALRTESIDLYQFHSGTDELFDDQSLWKTLSQQKALGRVRHLGVSILGKGSEHQAGQARRVGAEVLQVIYNRLDQRPEQLYFSHAERDKLGILARVPLASGLLSGKYSAETKFPSNEVRSTFDAAKLKSDLAQIEQIKSTEVPKGVSMAQWALAWGLKNRLVSAVIPGCKDPAQVRANADAAALLDTSTPAWEKLR